MFVLSGNRIAQYVFCKLNLCSALFLRFIYVETYSCVCFHCCVVFRFMNKPQFVLYCWACRLFPAFAYYTDWLLWTFLVPVHGVTQPWSARGLALWMMLPCVRVPRASLWMFTDTLVLCGVCFLPSGGCDVLPCGFNL